MKEDISKIFFTYHVDSRLSEVGGLSGEGLKRWRLGGVS